MAARNDYSVDPHVAQAIEDAILFGKYGDLEEILDDIAEDDAFPAELHNGIETLRYFREYYGPGAGLDQTGRKKVALMDSAWSMDLLNKLREQAEAAIVRQA